jgi:cysteine desulfurase/selenocysteine lyase
MLIDRIKKDFPIFASQSTGQPLVYLDSAATAQKPKCVIEAEREFYETSNANIHRGVYALSQKATELYDGTREVVRKFLNAKRAEEIIFVRGTTEGINLIASSYGRSKLQKGDEILISTMEHHSNIVPWQMLAEAIGASLKVIAITDNGELDLDSFKSLLSSKTKIVSLCHVSNTLGTINPVKEIIELSHQVGAVVILDGAQAVPHLKVDVSELDCDFYVFSAHKLYGPTGVGVLYGKYELLNQMPPYQGGGDMISNVTFEKTTYQEPPHRFEAGTPNIAGVVALSAAIEYLSSLDFEQMRQDEQALLSYAVEELSKLPGIRFIGTAKDKVGVISFVLDCAHPHDIGTILDSENIAIRTGHHCTQPLMDRFKVPATARASFGVYNSTEDIDRLVQGLNKVIKVFG